MHDPFRDCADYLWLALGLVWLVGAVTAKRTRRTQSSISRARHLTLEASAFFLVFWADYVAKLAGVALCLGAINGRAMDWTRAHRGRNRFRYCRALLDRTQLERPRHHQGATPADPERAVRNRSPSNLLGLSAGFAGNGSSAR